MKTTNMNMMNMCYKKMVMHSKDAGIIRMPMPKCQ